jgi:hypothetical protein
MLLHIAIRASPNIYVVPGKQQPNGKEGLSVGGTLSIAVTKSPFSKPSDEENFDIDQEIYLDEWEELFRNVLEVPEIKIHEGESSADFVDRQERSFQEYLMTKGYPMLGRIWFIYRDAFYDPSDVNKLLAECLELQQKAANEPALSTLKKLIFACREALRVKSGIWLISD